MIPIYQPFVAKNQKKYVNDCLDSNWISSRGEYIDKFEKALADFLGVKEAITVFNGSVSLMLILYALDIGYGDEVIVPSLTYAATISAVNLVGATAVLVDSDNNFQMNISQIEQVISKKTKAILVPELYGDAPDLFYLQSLCKSKSLYLIEDSAEAFGCSIISKNKTPVMEKKNIKSQKNIKCKNYMIGSFGDASSFSFFSNKNLPTGEGGLVCTNNKDLAAKMRLLKNQSHMGGFQHSGPGFNFRMTNIQAAIGLSQLEELHKTTLKKLELAKYYRDNLPSALERIIPKIHSTEWMPLFLLPESVAYIKFQTELLNRGIDSRPAFTPIHLMNGFNIRCSVPLTNSEKLYKRGVNLPSYPTLTKHQLEYIVNCIAIILKHAY